MRAGKTRRFMLRSQREESPRGEEPRAAGARASEGLGSRSRLSAAAVAARPAAERVKAESPLSFSTHDIRFAAREVSQRGGGARRGSVSERGTRLAVESLWASRGPVRQQAQVPSKRKRR